MLDYDNTNRFKDALDNRGILKDGKAVRVPTSLRDGIDPSLTSLQRSVANRRSLSDAELASHRPGFRYVSSYSWAERQALYDTYDAEIVRMWQTDFGNADYEECEAETLRNLQPHHGDLQHTDNDPISQMVRDHQRNMTTVYATYDCELSEAWRR